ncbi:related to RBTMx2 protein [Fusarium fujikuroi]|uniref:Related to RBTMx2 protein n=1 Tax=Gibberella fujikuroi (strain CBS 195.34 / IMI 58289 / NRRL A-6831) TaxID=1279085 RepID=S0EDB0_GIBF5|nr:related to RBTMx2 protein [Fusarium fujikuroi IMI 58289]KLO99168.1 RBTMx2 protein [Fusarium fujikuroi]KLP21453.1 RBTMx2 protein [Fusarium fujikuroi]CCT71827.1 related to RBTMx2 protein [Fusarium fujikuroi IMI 58289]SCO14129.1 related to RBTMx2 protein [Fusarium fujikuroi]SCO45445.1 related to RBTMx2 protein [Fusarium fujikuroi]
MSLYNNPSSNSSQNMNKSTMSSAAGETSTGYHDRHTQQGDRGSTSADSSGSQDASPSEGTANTTPRSSSTTSGDKPADSRMIVDDPFDNEKRQILFNAIDRLQACGSHKYLAIPQLVVVGEQSSGKSSLLRTLTDISFPVMAGIGTRFPIRVISRRSPSSQGSRERFRISLERAPRDVNGLQRADAAADEYRLEGDTLTMDVFEAALKDLSENKIGIRKGQGIGAKNFVPDIVRVELEGPHRSPFNILDLPGLISSEYGVNEPEPLGTQELAKEYISRQENTIICTIPATSDLGNQRAYQICKEHISDKRRLVGVFTKCDKADREEAERAVISAKSNIVNGDSIFVDGMFVVCNKTSESRVNEDEFFSLKPWSQIHSERRGSRKLKDHLGEILTREIEKAFPKLENDINSRLKEKRARLKDMGEPRLNYSQQQEYLNRFVREYSSKCDRALRRPGLLESETMDLRQKLNHLNTQFDNVMRWVGGFWRFEDEGVDPWVVCNEYGLFVDNKQEQSKTAGEILYPTPKPEDYTEALKRIPAFEEHEHVESFDKFKDTVTSKLDRFGASQPPGVVNSDIYPVIYRAQVSKWSSIAQEHLDRVKDAMKSSYEEILRFVCPNSEGTMTLHHELKDRLHSMFCETLSKAQQELDKYCEQETQKELLQTTNKEFSTKLEGWRMLRYARAFYHGVGGEEPQDFISRQTLHMMWTKMDSSGQDRMANDIHDVIKVYYRISLESFVSHVTQTIMEGFIMDKDGPLSKMTTEYVLSLPKQEVSDMTKEDKTARQLRVQLNREIKGLESDQEIAKEARLEVEALNRD